MTTAAMSSGDDPQLQSRIVTSDEELEDDDLWRPSSRDQRGPVSVQDPEAEEYTGATRDSEAQIFAELVAVDFEGPVWEAFSLAHAGYMADVLTGWICSGALGKILSAKRIPFWFTTPEINELEGDPIGGPVAMRLSVDGSWPTLGQTLTG